MTSENGEARTIGVPMASAGAAAHAPNQGGQDGPPPEYQLAIWNGKPVIYKIYEPEGGGVPSL
jgi:hypothetical protein